MAIRIRHVHAALVTIIVLAFAAQRAQAEQPSTWPSTLPATGPVVLDPEIVKLVEQTGDADPQVREQATQALLDRGRAVLPALGRAAHGADPEIRNRAAAILLKTPWDLPNDPIELRTVLGTYGSKTVEQRRQVVRWLCDQQGANFAPAWAAVGRILYSEPSYDVLWEVVKQIRLHPYAGSLEMHALQVQWINGPTKVVVARAMVVTRPQFAINLFLQALQEDREADPPARDREEIMMVVRDLARMAHESHNEAGLAGTLREEYPVTPKSLQPELTRELYMAHADAAIDGFAEDCKSHPPDWKDPITFYALARMEARTQHPRLAQWCRKIAFEMTPRQPPMMRLGANDGPFVARWSLAEFLKTRGWFEEAQGELNDILEHAPENDVAIRTAACLSLTSVDLHNGDDFLAAEHIQIAVDLMDRHPDLSLKLSVDSTQPLRDDRQSLLSTMHWFRLKAARKQKDAEAVERESLALAELKPVSDEMLLDAYPFLTYYHHPEAAQAIFDANYDALRARLQEGPGDGPTLCRLAWICAKCKQHLDVADVLIHRAMQIEPKDARPLAIYAEVEFAKGHLAEAVAIGEKVQAMVPTDPAARKNLANYRLQLKKAQKQKEQDPAENAPAK